MTPQELKNSILQLAIQGKLVPQDSNDEPAQMLLHRIKKVLPKQKPCKDELDFDAMDFNIPDTWDWAELNELFDFVDYRGKTPHKIDKGVFLITASNIRKGFMDYTRKEFISKEEYEDRQSRGVTHKGDLLFTTEAPMGNAALCDLDVCSCGQRIITFQPYCENSLVPTLYMYFILSPAFQKQLLANCTGTTAKGIKADKLKHFKMPLPPFNEQKRIVAKIKELLPLVDRYEQAWSKLEEFNKRFPIDMQKSILQMAIQGKLVPQDVSEGTGEELYKLIQAEKTSLIRSGKIKKDKQSYLVSEEDIPFDIPGAWKWVTFSDLFDIGSAIRIHQSDWRTEGIPFLRGRELVRLAKTGDPDAKIFISKDLYEINKSKGGVPQKGDLLVTAVGTLGKVYIVKGTKPFYYKDAYILRYNNYAKLYSEYFKYVIEAPFIQEFITQGSMGTTVAQLTIQKAKKMLCPLPPLAEQKRIVAKIEELLPLVDSLSQ